MECSMCCSPTCSRLVNLTGPHVVYGAATFCDAGCLNNFLRSIERINQAADRFGERQNQKKWHQRM